MSAEFIKREKNEVTLKLTIASKEFEIANKKAYDKLKGRFNIPGFRKGKAPMKIIEAQYGKGVFFEEAINEIFPVAFEAAVKEHSLDVVDRPSIDVEKMGAGEDLVIVATVTVKPEFSLGEYKGIEIEKVAAEVAKEAVEAEMKKLQEKNARLIVVEDRGVQENDMVSMNFKGTVDGVEFPGGTAENYSLVVGSKTFIPGFEDQMIGMNIGEEKDVNVTFPTEYHEESLAGKDAVFKVTVNEIKVKEMPELDDEFAKDVSEFETLAELEKDMAEKLEKFEKENAENQMKNAVLDKLIEATEIEIPDAMVENQIDNMIYDFDYQLRYQGLSLENYLKFTNTKKEDLRTQMRDDALNRVKGSLIMEAIAKQENLVASDEEFDKEVSQMAENYKMEVEKLKKSLREEDKEYIKETIGAKKTMDFLLENSKLV